MLADEYESVGKLKDEALRLLQAARIALMTHRPFYGTLVSSMPLVADWKWLPTAATDHRNLFYNPEFICGMPEDRKAKVFSRIDNHPLMTQQEKDDYKKYVNVFYRKKTMREIVFILVHELRHVTNDHMARGKAFDMKQYNIAADQYINTSNVMEFGPRSSSMKWFQYGAQTTFTADDKEFAFMSYCYCDFQYHGKTAEEIYVLINNKSPAGNALGTHIGDYDPNMDILGYTDPHPTKSTIEKDEDLTWSAGMIESALKAAGGEGPQEARDLVAKMGKPVIDYLTLIRQRMTSHRRSDLSYSRPSRRSGSVTRMLRGMNALGKKQSVVLPGRKKQQTIDIVIGFDVSGSISRRTQERIFNEIIGLCMLYQCFRVTLFCWSTRVGEVKVYDNTNIKEMLEYPVTSTGGTTAACAFEYIDKNIPDAQEVIIFTDGYIEDLKGRRDWAKKYDTLWVICDGRSGWMAPFGKAVDLDEHTK